jgi:hypothetical protein
MRAGCAGDELFLLYRAARASVHRDMTLLASSDHGATFRSARLDEWEVARCVMSTASLAPSGAAMVAAWEDEGAVAWTRIDAAHHGRRRAHRPARGERRRGRRAQAPVVSPRTPAARCCSRGPRGWHGSAAARSLAALHAGRRADRRGSGRADGVPPWSLSVLRRLAGRYFRDRVLMDRAASLTLRSRSMLRLAAALTLSWMPQSPRSSPCSMASR